MIHGAAIAAGLFVLALPGAGAQAGMVDFSDAACRMQTVCVKTISGGALDGTAATFSDPVAEAGGEDRFFNLHSGLGLGSGAIGYRWQVVFDQPVLWTGGVLGDVSSSLGFGVRGGDVDVAGLLSGQGRGGFALDRAIPFEAGVAYVFESGNLCAVTECGFLAFAAMTFVPAAPVALPVPAALLGGALAGLAALRARRRT